MIKLDEQGMMLIYNFANREYSNNFYYSTLKNKPDIRLRLEEHCEFGWFTKEEIKKLELAEYFTDHLDRILQKVLT